MRFVLFCLAVLLPSLALADDECRKPDVDRVVFQVKLSDGKTSWEVVDRFLKSLHGEGRD